MDRYYVVLALAAVAGGAIRAAYARKRDASRKPTSPAEEPVRQQAPVLRENFGNPQQRIWRFALIIPAILLFMALLVWDDPDVWLSALVMMPMALVAWRFSQAGVFPTTSGLRIVNVLSTKEFAWEDIDHFEDKDYPAAARLVLKDGTTFGVTALQPGNPLLTGKDKKNAGRVDELNQLLAYQNRSPRQIQAIPNSGSRATGHTDADTHNETTLVRALRMVGEVLCYLWAASGFWVLFTDEAQADARWIGIPLSIAFLVLGVFLTYKRVKAP